MEDFNFKNEIKFILVGTILIDIIVYAISIIFAGFTFQMILGLLLGSTVLIINMYHLYRNILKVSSLERVNRNPMMKGYLFRSFIICIAVFISFKCEYINTIGTIIPLFYPRVIYTAYYIIKGGK